MSVIPKRVVFDTNTLISAALISGSVPAMALRYAYGAYQLIVSEDTIAELRDVILRKKFDPYVSQIKRKMFLHKYQTTAQCITISTSISDCRDPKDNKFLELAISGNAQSIVTGDDDLLTLHPFKGVDILTPKVFIDR